MEDGGQNVDIMSLPIEDLRQIESRFAEELQFMQSSFGSLKMAASRFSQSREALKDFTPETKDRPMLVPLTSSLYVPGKLDDTEKVLVDVGTGYYIEKSIEDARTYLTKKIEMLKVNLEQVARALQSKTHDLDVVRQVLQDKMRIAQLQQQQQAAGGAD